MQQPQIQKTAYINSEVQILCLKRKLITSIRTLIIVFIINTIKTPLLVIISISFAMF